MLMDSNDTVYTVKLIPEDDPNQPAAMTVEVFEQVLSAFVDGTL